MELEYDISLAVNGKRLAAMELRALLAVQRAGSQNKAAAELGISVPVLHNYLRKAERKLGFKLVSSTPTSTRLTPKASELAQEYLGRCRQFEPRPPSVGLTPVSRLLVKRFLPSVRLYEGDDEGLLLLLDAGIVDAAIFDDPRIAASYPGKARRFPAGSDELLHVDRGGRYASLKYGAQRLGFDRLRQMKRPHMVVATFEEPERLLASGCSYFLSRRLAEARELRVEPSRRSVAIQHPVLGLARERRGLARLLEEMLGVEKLQFIKPGKDADYYLKR